MTHESPPLALVPIRPCTAPSSRETHGATLVGPGWFESSWELQRGLEVREEGAADAALRGWIDEFLRGQRAAGRIASPSASTAMA